MNGTRRYLVALLLLVGIGACATAVSAKNFHILPPKIPLDTTTQPSELPENCDQSSTTTPCSEIEAAQKAAALESPETTAPSTRPAPTYGPLVNTYTDAKYGFSLKYPKSFEIQPKGDWPGTMVLAAKAGSGSNFSMLISDAQNNSLSSAKAMADVERPYTYLDFDGYYTKIIPSQNSVVKLPNGAQVLRQVYSELRYDGNGKDVTGDICDECAINATRYILFKDPGNYFILLPGRSADADIQSQIINSIEY